MRALMVELRAPQQQAIDVAASADDAYALVADPQQSLAHFPSLQRVVQEGERYTWFFEPKGAGPVSIQLVCAVTYERDPAARVIRWRSVEGVGNGRTSGEWRVEPLSERSARLHLHNETCISVPLPRLLRPIGEALVARENRGLVATYLDNLRRTLAGGDGRLRHGEWVERR